MMKTLLLFLGLVASTLATLPLQLEDYGLASPSDDSCPTSGTGWFIDRVYNSVCFVRQVYCDDGVLSDDNGDEYRTCDNDQFYIADGGDEGDCYDSDSDEAVAACAVSVVCNPDSMGIIVTSDAIWDQTAADLQVGQGTSGCTFAYDSTAGTYSTEIDLTSTEWEDCGVTREVIEDTDGDGGLALKFTATIVRDEDRTELYEEYHHVTVTREKCFMYTAMCYYNADGTATASFIPSTANVLDESDTDELCFKLVATDCDGVETTDIQFETLDGLEDIVVIDDDGNDITDESVLLRPEIDEPAVYVNDEVCYRAKICSTWHTNIRLQIRKCWATVDGDEDLTGDSSSSYYLANRNDVSDEDWEQDSEGIVDSTFEWDCYGAYQDEDGTASTDWSSYYDYNRYIEDFRFDAFRFQDDDPNNPDYVQEIDVYCEVVACEVDDTTSDECNTECSIDPEVVGDPTKRSKREVSSTFSALTKSTVKNRLFVMPKKDQVNFMDQPTSAYNLLSDSFAMAMFGLGCVLAVVAIGLMVVLHQDKKKIKYGLMA